MSAINCCPTHEDLRRFLLGQFDECQASNVEEHLSSCPTCLEALNDLNTEDSLIAAMQAQLRTTTNPEQPLVQALVDRLAQAGPRATDPLSTTPWDGRSESAPASPMPEIEGFEIQDVLGRGGMGVVYKALQTSLGRTVALKMILDRPDAAEVYLDRFQNEARAVAALNDPHFVQIYEFGQSGGRPYMTLEFVEGGSLEEYRRGEPQPVRFSAQMVETLARAMHKAHAAGLVHRDLKPHNILLATDGTPKIADFGLVKRQTADDVQMTLQGTIMGTASYMAPEQTHNARDVTAAADVYALGGILYCLLTGRPPFLAATTHDTILAVRKSEVVPPSRLRPDTPRDLEVICLACLEKEPHKRYASAAELADDLRRYLEGRTITRRPVSALEHGWRWAKRNPLAATVAALVAVIAMGSSIGLWRLSVLNNSLVTQTVRAETEAGNARSAQAAKSEQYNAILEAFHGILFTADNRLRDNKQSVAVRKKLIEIALARLQAVRDLGEENTLYDRNEAIAYQRLGDIYLVSREAKKAQDCYDRAYDITQQVATTDEDDARHLRNLAILCDKQAEVLERLGETLAARQKYQEALDARLAWDKKLLAQGLDHQDAKTTIAESHAHLGRIQLLLGEPKSALDHLTQAKQGYEKAPSDDVDDAYALDYQLSRAYHRLGDVDKAGQLLDGVVAGFLELRKSNAKSVPHIRALADARVVAGDFQLVARKDVAKAWSFYKLAHAGYKMVWDERQDSASACSGMGKIEYRLGGLLVRAGEAGITLKDVPEGSEPLTHFQRCCELRQKVAEIDPHDMQARMEWAMALARAGRTPEAIKQANLFLKTDEGNPRLLFEAACTFALASQTDDPALAAQCREQALAVLEKLKASGWKDPVTLRDDPDLAPLQSEPKFQELLSQLTTDD